MLYNMLPLHDGRNYQNPSVAVVTLGWVSQSSIKKIISEIAGV